VHAELVRPTNLISSEDAKSQGARSLKKHLFLSGEHITLFKSIKIFFGIDNILCNILLIHIEIEEYSIEYYQNPTKHCYEPE
jgi:hypothetical protein